MRERVFLRKCDCKQVPPCGKDVYSLGTYRGFKLTQEPFYNGWAIYGEIENPDALDTLLMQDNTFKNKFFLDTETSDHYTLEQCENSVTKDIDYHWETKQRILDNASKYFLAKHEGAPVKEIRFYSRKTDYGWLSNFHRAEEIVDGIKYPTNEHYYQSMKVVTTDLKERIRLCEKPVQAMILGRQLHGDPTMTGKVVPPDDWTRQKVGVMLTGLRAKFTQNPELRRKLIDTGDALLIEDSPTDMFWGGKLEGSMNMLGLCLMQVRKELQTKVPWNG